MERSESRSSSKLDTELYERDTSLEPEDQIAEIAEEVFSIKKNSSFPFLCSLSTALLDAINQLSLKIKKEPTEKLLALKTHALALSELVESLTNENIRDLHRKDESKEVSIEDMLVFLKTLTDVSPTLSHLPAIIRKYLREGFTCALTQEELEMLPLFKDSLSLKKPKGHDRAVLKALKAFIDEILEEAKRAFKRGINVIQNLDEKSLSALQKLDTLEKDPTYLLDCYRVVSRLYWEFHDPFEMQIDFLDFLKLALSKDKNLFSDLLDPKDTALIRSSRLIASHAQQIISISSGAVFDRIRSRYPQVVVDTQTALLIERRTQNQHRSTKTVNIAGAGPCGLVHALVCHLKGFKVNLFEPRPHYTRENIIKINFSQVMNYFGIYERLLLKNAARESKEFSILIEVKIKDIEMVLLEIARDLFGSDALLTRGHVVDLRLGSREKGDDEKEGFLIESVQEPKTVTWVEGDLFVDATGKKAQLARQLHIKDTLLGRAQYMLAVILNQPIHPSAFGPIRGISYSYANLLSTHTHNYVLLQPSDELITHLEELEDEGSDKEIKRIYKKILKEVKVDPDNVLDISPFYVELRQRNRPSLLSHRSLLLFSGDALVIPDPKSGAGVGHIIQSSTLFSLVLDGMRSNTSIHWIQRRFDFATMAHMKEVTHQGFLLRELGDVMQLSRTFEALLALAHEKRWISEQDVKALEILKQKSYFDIAFSPVEKKHLANISDALHRLQLEGDQFQILKSLKEEIEDLKRKGNSDKF